MRGGALIRRAIFIQPRRSEPIAHAWHRLDRKGRVLISRRKLSELADAAINGVVADGQTTPAAKDQVVLRDYRAARVRKRHEDLHHPPLKRLGGAVPFNFAQGGADAEQPQIEVRL